MPSLDAFIVDLKDQMKPYALIGLLISIGSIILASMMVSYNLTGSVSIGGILKAQATNPALWILDVSALLFFFWGQMIRVKLQKTAESILDDQTEELRNLNSNLARQLNYESNYDGITKLPNHSQLIQKINQAIENAAENELVAVISLTIKGFEELTYNFGTYHMNTILKQFAEKLKKLWVMPFMIDARMGMGFLAHTHGNEFGLLIPAVSKDINIDDVLQKITLCCKTECTIDENKVTVIPLLGASLYPKDGDSADILVHRADVALFHAKKDRNGYALYSPSMENGMAVDRAMLDELKKAIDNDDLEIYYQPNIELSTGKIIGAEALIRFSNPEFGMINADKLIPLVEGLNLMKQLTTIVLKGVCKQLAEWHRLGYDFFISVNLSSADAVDIELPKQIKQLLDEYQLPPKALKVELTERACLQEPDNTLSVLNALFKMGVKITIEDFCGGYSSFNYLMNFPISEVKIDKTFVIPMLNDHQKHKMVIAIVALSKALGLDVYAIGIENEAIVKELLAIGCLYGQGFYYSKAVNGSHFTQLLSEDPNLALLNATRSNTGSLPI